jgi:hypothetical protein
MMNGRTDMLLGDITPDTGNGLLNWVLAVVILVIGALTSVITMFYKQERERNAQDIKELKALCAASDKKHEECLLDRRQLEQRIMLLEQHQQQLPIQPINNVH